MSTSAAPRSRPSTRPERLSTQPSPRLRVVAGSRREFPLFLVVVALAALILGIVVPLIINTQMVETSYLIHDQQIVLNELEAESQTLQVALNEASSPAALEEAARAQGMMPAESTGFITLETGTISGGSPTEASE